MTDRCVLGIDSGLTDMGAAIYWPTTDEMKVEAFHAMSDPDAPSKADLRAKKAAFHARMIVGLIAEYDPVAVCAEQLSWARVPRKDKKTGQTTWVLDARASGEMGIAWGALAAAVELAGKSLVTMYAKTIKQHFTGSQKASKGLVATRAMERWPEAGWHDRAVIRKHQADGAAVVWSCVHHNRELRIALEIAGGQAPLFAEGSK